MGIHTSLGSFFISNIFVQGLQAILHQVNERVEPIDHLQQLDKQNIGRMLLADVHQFMPDNSISRLRVCADKKIFEKGKSGIRFV